LTGPARPTRDIDVVSVSVSLGGAVVSEVPLWLWGMFGAVGSGVESIEVAALQQTWKGNSKGDDP